MRAQRPFTAELRREEVALKELARTGAKLPPASNELKSYLHDKTKHRVPDADERKQIMQMFSGQMSVAIVGTLLELHEYRVLEVLAADNRKYRDKRD